MKTIYVSIVLIFLFVNSYGQWKAIPGPNISSENLGQEFSELIVDGDFLCAIINGFVHISYNNGQSWMYASGTKTIDAFVMTCSGSNIYIGNGGGMFWSKNFGSTYVSINSNLPKEPMIGAVLVKDGVLAAAVQSYNPIFTNEVYISDNNGQTWSIAEGLSGKVTRCLETDGINLYAGTEQGVYRSTDNGKNWNSIGLNDKGIFKIEAKNNMIFAAEANSGGSLYLSTDNGKNWKALNNNGLTTNSFSSIVIADNHVYVAAGWDGVFRSDDNGLSWTKLDLGSGIQIANVMTSDGNKLFTGFYNGIAISSLNATSLNRANATFNLDVRSVAFSGPNLITTTNQGINTSSDDGLNWERNYIDMNVFGTIDSVLYIGGENGFFRSDDFGKNLNWQNVKGLPDHPKFTDIVANGSAVFASLYDHGVYFSNDFGWNWSAVNNGLTSYKLLGLTMVDSTIFAASEDKGVFRSTNFGLSWSSASNGILDKTVTCLSSYKNNIFAGTNSSGIFKSVDNGENWVQIQNEFPNSKILSLYSYGTNIFAGVEGKGFYMSANNGTDWLSYNTGLYNLNVNSIAENDLEIYLGTKGGAIWKRALKDFPLSLSIKSIKTSDRVTCEGSAVVLTAQVIGGQKPYSYNWSNGSQSPSITVNPLETTNYEVTVTDASSTTVNYDITIWVKPKPEAPIITMDGDTLVSNYPNGNIWMIDGKVISYDTTNRFLPSEKGKYSAMVSVNGCMSDLSNVIVSDVNKHPTSETVKIFPNPAKDILNIEISQSLSNSVFSIINIEGQVIIRQKITKDKTIVDTGHLPRGIYVVRLESDDIITVKKILIE